MIPSDIKYTKEHEWIRLEGNTATVGLTTHASEELGELVFVELPEIDSEFEQMEEFGSVESVKTVSSMFMPMSGKITETNSNVSDSPETINKSPYEDGWMIKFTVSDEKEYDDLLSSTEYENFLEELQED